MEHRSFIAPALDLSDPGNIVQARHELHKAVDFAGESERAAWALKWGEAALAAGEKASRATEEWDGVSPPKALEAADATCDQLVAELAEEKPDIEKCRRLARRVSTRLEEVLQAVEE